MPSFLDKLASQIDGGTLLSDETKQKAYQDALSGERKSSIVEESNGKKSALRKGRSRSRSQEKKR